jgi:hypothetical protein
LIIFFYLQESRQGDDQGPNTFIVASKAMIPAPAILIHKVNSSKILFVFVF